MMDKVITCCIGAAAGVGMHRGLFIRGEWHVQSPYIFISHLLGFSYLIATGSSWHIYSTYLFALFTSITTYRLLSHRLSHFPGPFGARITKLWHLWKVRTSQNHFLLADLQRQYGDFVRTGPSEITVFHPNIFMAVDGPHSKCDKGEWYDLLHPNKALVTARTRHVHRDRRRQWNQGFTSKVLPYYKGQLLSLIDQLETVIDADIAAGRASDISDYITWFGFDRMGEFVLGKSFNMLRTQGWHHIILRLQNAMSILGPLSPVPWLVQIAFRLMPRVWVLNDWFTTIAWCNRELKQAQTPASVAAGAPHLAHYLKDDSEDKTYEGWLTGDSLLAIVAGSEPTAGVLIGLLYELAKHPDQADKIHHEILQSQVDIRDSHQIAQHCPHLEAAINEALRLYPATPTGGNRKTPDDAGITVAGTYIPPATTIVSPKFVIGRREDCFKDANEFIPERWTTHPDMVLNSAAFSPFGTGHRSCLGRALAMNDLSLITAHIIRRYRIRFPPGETGDSALADWRDQFTSRLGRLSLVFEERDN